MELIKQFNKSYNSPGILVSLIIAKRRSHMKGINKNESAPVAWPSTEPSINKYPRAERHKEQPEPALTNMWPSQQQTPKLGSTPKKYEERDSFEETYLP